MRPGLIVSLAGCALLAACGSKDNAPDPNGGLLPTINAGPTLNKDSFADPNPLPCTAADADPGCLVDSTLQGWHGCCHTDYTQDPAGKCGVQYGASSGCVERVAPGNLDSTCSADGGPVSWTNAFRTADGPACCAWRTKQCGGWDDTYGCVPIPNRAADAGVNPNQGIPCAPRYDQGIVAAAP